MVTESELLDRLRVLWDFVDPALERDAFGFDGGRLGCAYLAGALLELDDSYPWKTCFEQHTSAILHSISKTGYPHPGMLGGLAGLTFLLRSVGNRSGDYATASAKLERRLSIHIADQVKELTRSIGADRYTYDFAVGLSGLLYHFACFPSLEETVADTIKDSKDFLRNCCLNEGLGGLWTPPTEVPNEILESDPATSLGLLDLGMAHGTTGVLCTLLAGGLRQGDSSVDNIVENLSGALEMSVTSTIPYYLCLNPNFSEEAFNAQPNRDQDRFQHSLAKSLSGPAARNAWCYGTPMLEVLQHRYNLSVPESWQESFTDIHYVDSALGGFSEAGLCHGLAGRIALRYMIGLPVPKEWEEGAKSRLSEPSKQDWGFWDQRGSLLIVEIARSRNVALPAVFALLGGMEGTR